MVEDPLSLPSTVLRSTLSNGVPDFFMIVRETSARRAFFEVRIKLSTAGFRFG